MKNLFLLIALFFVTAISFAQSHVRVNGYYRSNGTYVQAHYRTSPDKTINNNWSTKGNVNPYTGKSGTVQRAATYSGSYIRTTTMPTYSNYLPNYYRPTTPNYYKSNNTPTTVTKPIYHNQYYKSYKIY